MSDDACRLCICRTRSRLIVPAPQHTTLLGLQVTAIGPRVNIMAVAMTIIRLNIPLKLVITTILTLAVILTPNRVGTPSPAISRHQCISIPPSVITI